MLLISLVRAKLTVALSVKARLICDREIALLPNDHDVDHVGEVLIVVSAAFL